KSASCKSFFNFFNDINSSLTSFGDFVGLTFSSGTGTVGCYPIEDFIDGFWQPASEYSDF
ncbi:DUF1482 family protein, partial [Klebsiella pneumoniae]|uniref:DUF1482 family protein n=1 Tax=Klebsiella pneumoniae TaxID=573 RepID=UPI0023F74812